MEIKMKNEKDIRRNKVHEIVRSFGGGSRCALKLNVVHSSICAWLKKSDIPELRCYQIEVLSGGKFKAKDLFLIYIPKFMGG
jgi:hypothetical protein